MQKTSSFKLEQYCIPYRLTITTIKVLKRFEHCFAKAKITVCDIESCMEFNSYFRLLRRHLLSTQSIAIPHLICQGIHNDRIRHKSQRMDLSHQHVCRNLVELNVLQEVPDHLLKVDIWVRVAILLAPHQGSLKSSNLSLENFV